MLKTGWKVSTYSIMKCNYTVSLNSKSLMNAKLNPIPLCSVMKFQTAPLQNILAVLLRNAY